MISPAIATFGVLLFFCTVFMTSFAISFAAKLAGDFDTHNFITILAVVLAGYAVGYGISSTLPTFITLEMALLWTIAIACIVSLLLTVTFQIKGLVNLFIYWGMSVLLSTIANILILLTAVNVSY